MLDEGADEDLISEDVVEDNGSSNISNAASSCISVQRGREHFCKAGIKAEDLMVTDERWRPPALDGVRSNGMFSNLRSLILELTNKPRVAFRQWIFYRIQRTLLLIVGSSFPGLEVILIRAENGQRNEGYDSVATVQPFQNTPSEPFPTTGIGRGHDFAMGKLSLRLRDYSKVR